MVRHDVTRLTSVLYACLADAFGNSTAVASACKAIVAPVEDLPAGVKVQRKRLVRSGEVLLGGGVNFWFDKQFGFTGKFGATAQLNFKITTEGAGFGDDSEPFIIKLLAGDLESLEVAPVEGEPLLNGASVRLRVRGMDEYSNPVSLGGSPVTVSSAAMIISGSEFVADEDPCAGVLSFTVVAPDPGKFECKVQCGEISKCAPSVPARDEGRPFSHCVCVCVCNRDVSIDVGGGGSLSSVVNLSLHDGATVPADARTVRVNVAVMLVRECARACVCMRLCDRVYVCGWWWCAGQHDLCEPCECREVWRAVFHCEWVVCRRLRGLAGGRRRCRVRREAQPDSADQC
jgi:hypothetical protein